MAEVLGTLLAIAFVVAVGAAFRKAYRDAKSREVSKNPLYG